MRKEYGETDITLKAMGEEYGLREQTMSAYKRREGWKKKEDEAQKANEAEARRLYEEGIWKNKDIAYACNMTIWRLQYLIRSEEWGSKKRMTQRLDDDQKEEMKKLCDEGIMSIKEIANKFGVCENTVRHHIKTKNWGETGARKHTVPKEIKERVKKVYEETEMPVSEIAEKYGVREAWIRTTAYRREWVRESDRIKWAELRRKEKEEEERLKMMSEKIAEIKAQVEENVGKQIKVKTWDKGGKHSKTCDEFTGTVKAVFRNVFTVQKKSGLMTSFSYVDIFEKGCPGARTEVSFNR